MLETAYFGVNRRENLKSILTGKNMPTPSGYFLSSSICQHRHHSNQIRRLLAFLSTILVILIGTSLLLFILTVRCDQDDKSAEPGLLFQNGHRKLDNSFGQDEFTNKINTIANKHANSIDAANQLVACRATEARSHRLIRRWAPTTKKPRVQMAQKPTKSTTTTTSTSSSTTIVDTSKSEKQNNPGQGDEEEEQVEEEDEQKGPVDSGDYEELRRAKQKSSLSASNTIQVTPGEPDQVNNEVGEEEEGEEVDEQEELTTTTTTTTTVKPRQRIFGGGARRKSPKRLPASSEESQQSSKSKPGKTSVESDKLIRDGESSNKTTVGNIDQHKKKALLRLPFIKPKNTSSCTPEAYKEFPRDFMSDKWRARGGLLIHVAIVCYMFYSLALVCERYFMPSLEEFAQRLQLSEDVAGATLMSAGSSAPELFTAILGVFVAKGDVGTGAIVGSAVFNILFVIGLCAFVSTTSAQLQWWPVLRDSVYYTFTVLVLILIIYDERITAYESASMILLYGVYIAIMAHNEQIKQIVSNFLLSYPITAKLFGDSAVIQVDGPDDVFGSGGGLRSTSSMRMQQSYELNSQVASSRTVEEDSIFMAALLVIVKHKRLFRSQLRFQSAARYIIIKRQHRAMRQQQRQLAANEEVNYFGPDSDESTGLATGHSAAQRAKMDAYARSTTTSKQKFSIVSKDDYEFWHRPPDENENYYLWMARIPVNYILHYTVPDCTLYPDKYIITFIVSIVWTAIFSYIMVWMVTLIGYTLGIPDSVMGVTFLAAGTSVPDCYSSLHAARNGMADMAVSNSIGSNVFDILIGLSVPWFIQSAIYPGLVATVNSRGVIYSVILLFLSLIVTIYLLNKYDWSLQPRLGLALLIAYGLFIILTSMLEFNLFGHVNPPPC